METRTAGSASGLKKRASGNVGTALRADSTTVGAARWYVVARFTFVRPKAKERIRVPRARHGDRIDRTWLQEQAGTLFRTNDDIANELGLRGETIRRYRRDYRIPGRAAGSGGHVVTNLHHPNLPLDIRRAVEGQRNGWQRLHRFQQMMAYPSMNAAAAALGLHTQNLNLQIERLETDIGAPILQRAPHRYAPMAPTRRGQRLLDHLAKPDIHELLDSYAEANVRPKCGPYRTKPGRSTTDGKSHPASGAPGSGSDPDHSENSSNFTPGSPATGPGAGFGDQT